jgi:phage/plasmid-like protein (TIGR03299 family)
MSIKSVFDYLPEINADTAEEMAKQAGLDFNAVKVDLHYRVEEETAQEPLAAVFAGTPVSLLTTGEATGITKEKEVLVPDKVAVVREDDGRYLGTVGRNRGIVQYRDVLAFTESLVSEGDASYVTAGVTGNGQQAYLVMKTNNAAKLSGEDEVECYFYVTTSHDSTKGLVIVPCALRKVNGTVLTDENAPRIRFRHSSRVEDRIKRAKASVDRVNNYFATMEESFRLLRSVRLTTAQFNLYVESLFPDPDERPKRAEAIREDITSIYRQGAAQQLPSTKGTMLGAYFAVVEWVDKIRQQKASKVRPNEFDAKLHSLLEGSGAQSKSDAYAFALDMARKLDTVSFASSGGTNAFATQEEK